MFFSGITPLCVRQRCLPSSLTTAEGAYCLMFFPKGTDRLYIGDKRYDCGESSLFCVPPGSRFSAFPPKNGDGTLLSIEFALTNPALIQAFSLAGPELVIDRLTLRSNILNIMSCYSLQPPMYADSINYCVISLLYFGYMSSSKEHTPHPALLEENIFTCSPNEKLNVALNYIDEHLSDEFSVADMGLAVHLSVKQLSDIFRYEYGCTVLQFVSRFRLFKAKELMCYTNYGITEISELTGFKSIHYFSRYFKEKEDMSPIEYKRAVMRQLDIDSPGP